MPRGSGAVDGPGARLDMEQAVQMRYGAAMVDTPIHRVAQERELFLRLLELSRAERVDDALEGALALMVALSGARRGYIGLHEGPRDAQTAPRWWCAHGFDEDGVQTVRDRISTGIIAEALARGETVTTSSAVADPRFDMMESVRQNRIAAVLCAPIGATPTRGVLYLEGRTGGGAFGPDIRALAELFAAHSETVVSRALARAAGELLDPTAELRARLKADRLVGKSRAIARVLHTVSLVAPLDATVLITGATGIGKGLAASLIVPTSARASRPFISLNCATLPDNLLESELFGTSPGAFTGAVRRQGRVGAAEGGTLFLDEVSELSLHAQAKLLQLLQERTFVPLGSNTPQHANVRVLAATNDDLEAAVAAGRFRDDLYYRLKVLTLELPPLDARREDIPILARHLCDLACRELGLPALALSDEAVAAAVLADWPGHVRELDNALKSAVVHAHGDGQSVVSARHLFPSPPEGKGGALTFQEATRQFQRTWLKGQLDACKGNIPQTAARIGVARSHLYTLVNSLGVDKP